MQDRPTANPTNRFHSTSLTYDDGEAGPPSAVTIIDDHSRSIMSSNDSPDIGFSYSVNPYRGCQTACAYCLDGETPILMADARTRRLADLQVGDEIYGTTVVDGSRTYVRTTVLAHWTTVKQAYRIELSDGTSLVASGDHRFLSNRGWKYVIGDDHGAAQRPHLTTTNELLGTGRFATPPDQNEDYRRGYLTAMIRGDATLRRHDCTGRRGGTDVLSPFRLALVDLEALHRARAFLDAAEVATEEFELAVMRAGSRELRATRTSSRPHFERIAQLIEWPDRPTLDWDKGFLAGIFDAEGTRSEHVLQISSMDREVIDHITNAMQRLRFDSVVETIPRDAEPIFHVRLRGGLGEHLRFFHTTAPAITRKWSIEGQTVDGLGDRRVVSITAIGTRTLYDITTGTEDFIANGVISHNCYARPSHEYLDLGAGTDFDTKIVVKRDAPELLRAAFDKPSWRGELVMFSGVTDCYQPVERELELTRKCLEVCLEYRNPVAIISKHALIERDVELIAELGKQASANVSVSLTWVDAELARMIEPWAPSPERRFKVIETFAKAGVRVGVMCAPIIPGLNDNQIIRVLERARDAGASYAGWVLLRLPGAVAQVFPERVRAAMPLAADKILHRIRETRGGDKLYDSRFGVRGRGEGAYAETIKMLFDSTTKRLGLNDRQLDSAERPPTFRRPDKPVPPKAQLSLF